MKRIRRTQPITPEEAAKLKKVRSQVAAELPELVARHHERLASLDQLEKLCGQLKAAREAKGLSLADVTELTGMDRSALSKLETGQRTTPPSKPSSATPKPSENASWSLSPTRADPIPLPPRKTGHDLVVDSDCG